MGDDERRRTRLLDRKSQSTERSGRALERKAIVGLFFCWVGGKGRAARLGYGDAPVNGQRDDDSIWVGRDPLLRPVLEKGGKQ